MGRGRRGGKQIEPVVMIRNDTAVSRGPKSKCESLKTDIISYYYCNKLLFKLNIFVFHYFNILTVRNGGTALPLFKE